MGEPVLGIDPPPFEVDREWDYLRDMHCPDLRCHKHIDRVMGDYIHYGEACVMFVEYCPHCKVVLRQRVGRTTQGGCRVHE